MALTAGQQRCVDTTDVPLVVAAGAGSGKTFTLTKRIVEALKRGTISDIDEVCAITFTKKAAAELKSRIKGELRACGLAEQALKVDEAWVSTIHGMCARILRAHALELGIDPAFEVAEGHRVDDYMARAIDAVLVKAQAGEFGEQVDALFEEYRVRSAGGFGASVESMLGALVNAAAASADGVGSFVMPGVSAAPQVVVEQTLDTVEALLALAAGEKEGAKRDDWMGETEQLAESARLALAKGVDSYQEALSLVSPFKLAKTFGSKEYKAQVDEARGVVGALVMEARLGLARRHLETLVALTGRVLEVFSRMKRDDGVLDNTDLLVQAAQAIEDNPSIAALYADKFKLVMVDEFQDTDQMQVDMIKRLSGEGACRLCTVGDAQQSIYRFRGADVSVYRRHLESIRSGWPDSVIELSQNFRSHADVLSFVDRVFEKPDMFGGEFMSLSAGRDESRVAVPFKAQTARVSLQHTTTPWRGVNARFLLKTAAQRIAREFAALEKAGHSAGDMVVLLGRMTHADVYAQALRDAGLPCVISGGSVFSRTPEARVIRELVRVIANPHESKSLFNVLTSPLFGLTSGDLLSCAQGQGPVSLNDFWRAVRAMEHSDAENSPYDPRLSCALEVMGAVRKASGNVAVARIVETVIADSGWLTRMQIEGAEGLAAAGNAYKAIRIIDGIERSGANGPVSVMRRFEEALAGSKEAPGALSVAGGNSVRIMTIHASKGLEFPIVAVAEVKEDKPPTSKLLVSSVQGKTFVSLDLDASVADSAKIDLENVKSYVLGLVGGEDELEAAVTEEAGAVHRRLALRDYMAVGDQEESKRLLYVAITRAKEAVIVSSTGKCTKDNPLGVPRSALEGVFEALDPSGNAFAEGTSHADFGGSSPARIERVSLLSDDDDKDGDGDGSAERDSHGKTFVIPQVPRSNQSALETYRPLRDGVFSYSSISEAAHEGDVLKLLAEAHTVSVDRAAENNAIGDYAVGGAFGGFADDFWDEDPSQAFDEDRATDLGTAFHRLAQYAVVSRAEDGQLVSPPRSRVEALSLSCNLDSEQRMRLAHALDRWFGCDEARRMETLSRLGAEVPFFVSIPTPEGDRVYLEGEIDLIGFDEERSIAYVVDYKTGGNSAESEEDLRCKHVLQAACYAYSIMRQGIDAVEACFARVEQPRYDDERQPQCVRYRFGKADVPRLESHIADVYRRASRA